MRSHFAGWRKTNFKTMPVMARVQLIPNKLHPHPPRKTIKQIGV